MKKFAFVLASIYLASGHTCFADEFQTVKCGADIAKAMIGRRSSNETIVVTEKKYQALGLKQSAPTRFPTTCLRSVGAYAVRNTSHWSTAAGWSAT